MNLGGGRLTISDNGSLTAIGVLFTSQSSTARSAWAGIYATQGTSASNQPELTIINSTIQYADIAIGVNQGTTVSSVYINPRALITLTGSTIANSRIGVELRQGKSEISFNETNINNTSRPIDLIGTARLQFGTGNVFNGNDLNGIRMNFSTLSDSLITTGVSPVPFTVENNSQNVLIQTDGYMNIGSGNVFKFADNASLQVNGVLIANANVNETITFTSFKDDNILGDTNNDGTATSPTRGIWSGI